MKVIQRLYQYIEFKQISLNAFDVSIDASNGYIGKQIKNNASIGSEIIQKISETYTDLSIEWLITGTGSMLKEQNLIPTYNNVLCESPLKYNDNNNRLISYTVEKINDLERRLENEKRILEILQKEEKK